MSRVCYKNRLIARRTTQVLLDVRSQGVQQRKHAFLWKPLWEKALRAVCGVVWLAKGLTIRVCHSTTPHALHPMPQSQCRDHINAFRASQTRPKKHLGFTLIEVLVALVIFAVLSALSYRSLSALLQTKDRIDAETARWREVMIFFNRLELDLRQSVNRPVTIDKSIQAAWIGKSSLADSEDAQLILSRLGAPEQNGLLMDTQRLGYRYNAGKVELLIWPALDIESLSKPSVYTALSGVKSMSLRYMQHKTYQWVSAWPTEVKEDVIPKAVEIQVVLNTGEKLNRIYYLR